MTNDLLYQIALTRVPNIGDVHARALVEHYGDAASVFTAKRKELENLEGIGIVRANNIKSFSAFGACEDEIKFIAQYKVQPLFITSDDYPQRLLNCYDCPVLIYFRGNANLNCSRIISIVGTRNNTDYGKAACERLLEDLTRQDILVVSGLAFGIDTIAHKAALRNGLPTVGVLAHGLDRIYPSQNRSLAKQMAEQGGLLTEFPSNTIPDKQNFPKRNRIVAGMCDAIVVVETTRKGGSMITAELGNGYNKDVFAFPGRITDPKSDGCNYLVKSNKASLISSAADLLEIMNWKVEQQPLQTKQRELFIDLSADERVILDLLASRDGIQIDKLYFKSGLSSSAMAAALLMLEMHGLVKSLPGKIYQLL